MTIPEPARSSGNVWGFYRDLVVAFVRFVLEGVRQLSVERVINYPVEWVCAKTREYNSPCELGDFIVIVDESWKD